MQLTIFAGTQVARLGWYYDFSPFNLTQVWEIFCPHYLWPKSVRVGGPSETNNWEKWTRWTTDERHQTFLIYVNTKRISQLAAPTSPRLEEELPKRARVIRAESPGVRPGRKCLHPDEREDDGGGVPDRNPVEDDKKKLSRTQPELESDWKSTRAKLKNQYLYPGSIFRLCPVC
jgi:hypothetical protein